MKILIAFLLFTTFSFGSQAELDLMLLEPDSVFTNESLGPDETVLNFYFTGEVIIPENSIQYSIDGIQGKLKENQPLQLKTTKGSHNLQFYVEGGEYYENYSAIYVEGQKEYFFTIYFRQAERMIMTEKPVIYLYPEKTKDVQVEVVPKGDFSFTYPEYNDGWNVRANPDGSLIIDDEKYNYLFWESTEKYTEMNEGDTKGFVVEGENATAFLEEKLITAGLNAQERTDFITYWAPRMTQHENVFIQFKFNSDCNDHATLNITPNPDEIYRIYILWRPTENLVIQPKPQSIPVMKREGFTVVEWGGQKLPTIKNF